MACDQRQKLEYTANHRPEQVRTEGNRRPARLPEAIGEHKVCDKHRSESDHRCGNEPGHYWELQKGVGRHKPRKDERGEKDEIQPCQGDAARQLTCHLDRKSRGDEYFAPVIIRWSRFQSCAGAHCASVGRRASTRPPMVGCRVAASCECHSELGDSPLLAIGGSHVGLKVEISIPAGRFLANCRGRKEEGR